MVNSFGLDSHPLPNFVSLVLVLILAFLCLDYYLHHFVLAALIIYLVVNVCYVGVLLMCAWWLWCSCTGREDWDIPGLSGPQLQDDDDAGSRRSGIQFDLYLQCRRENPEFEVVPNEIERREIERRWIEYRRDVYEII